MNSCTRINGKGFLAGTLKAAEESNFVEHLDHCPRCRRWLEKDAGDEEAWRIARELLAPSRDLEFAANSAISSAAGLVDQAQRAYPELAFLVPSDDPAMMGRLGSYEVIGILGRGGMGIVLKGFDRALGRNVAIKLLDPVLANHGAARQRFAREARAMAAISHEHVVPIYAVDEHANLPYFVMEYVPGGTLECRLRREGRLEVVEVVRIGLQVAAALAAAHRQGLVHRDIKPSNVLLDQGTERVRVADFGLARAANDASFTRSGILAGTPLYMAPEQIRGENCDGQSDLFSLGSLMYELCLGHPPFRAETMFAVMQRIVHDPPRSLREQNSDAPTWLEDLIFRLLSKDKAERFGTAEEVAGVLESELAHLQNPRLVVEPARVWRRTDRGLVPQPRMRTGMRVAALGGLLVAAIAATWWLVSGPWPETVGTSGASSSTTVTVTTPLWDVDGTREALAALRKLDAESRDSFADPRLDPWPQEMQQIRQRFGKLSADFQEPWDLNPR